MTINFPDVIKIFAGFRNYPHLPSLPHESSSACLTAAITNLKA